MWYDNVKCWTPFKLSVSMLITLNGITLRCSDSLGSQTLSLSGHVAHGALSLFEMTYYPTYRCQHSDNT